MSAVYTKRLFAGALGPGAHTVGPVPPGRVWVILNMVAVPESQAAASVAYVSAGGATIWGAALPASNNATTYLWSSRVVVYAGESLTVTIGPSTVDLTITGYDFAA